MFSTIRRKFCVDFINPKNESYIDKSVLKPFLAKMT